MLRVGIVGLPNVGKSTLFNALTRSSNAESANYPFCTIDPNVGVVTVPDERLAPLAEIEDSAETVHATVEFVDIAGLVAGASNGEGMGNQFLSHIREVDAVVQVVRCFEDSEIHHVAGEIDPVRDIETITTELILADLDSLRRQIPKLEKDSKRGDKEATLKLKLAQKIEPHLDEGKPAITFELEEEEKAIIQFLFLLTGKPTILAANVKDSDLAETNNNQYVETVRAYGREHHGCDTVVISAQIESELADLNEAEAAEFLSDLGVKESGVGQLIRAAYHLLGLRTYFTSGPKETRAWTIRIGDTAPQAAGVIHTDFERGFIKAETVSYEALIEHGSIQVTKEKGLYRQEGKDYVVQDGDVILFKFNV
ncbi:MAG: redox-regulated ATPase YchF [Verrucomicrobiota bacterium]|nr:redox-regulated ATPase YchF [Verrucomicrobiota bacterium]